MASLTIQIPDEIAEKALKIGILQSENLQRLIEQAIIEAEQSHLKLQKSGRFTVFAPAIDGHIVTAEQIQKILDEEGWF